MIKTKANLARFFDGKNRAVFIVCVFALLLSACAELEKPKTETFYSETKPPAKQEFRWTNGKLPKSFDPALASAPPETDVVRAIYDGLTENDPKTLKAIPALAYEWESSDKNKKWTFKLRKDAKWSNGEKLTAKDFVRSWKRLSKMGEKVSHHEFLKNIVGMKKVAEPKSEKETKTDAFSSKKKEKDLSGDTFKFVEGETVINTNKPIPANEVNVVKNPPEKKTTKKKVKPLEFGVKAVGDFVLEVRLIRSDKDFANLVAHPIFRPVYASGNEFEKKGLNANVVTSGAFRITSVGKDGVTLDRSDHYYNKEKIKLERVRFVPTDDVDSALEAYKSGEVDAVTNAQIEPLALKLLTPYGDFKRTTHSALNFYEFNRKKEPFNDRRVRQALAVAIDRERITKDEMDGATKPAFNYLPFDGDTKKAKFSEDLTKAKNLLDTAGFPDGKDFPKVKLVVNRNNVQQRIAKSVAKMWKENLKIETEILVKESDEMDNAKKSGEYDVVRRGVVLPTSDETANMLAIFSPKKFIKTEPEKTDIEPKGNEASEDSQSTRKNESEKDIPNEGVTEKSNQSAVESKPEGELLIDIGDDEKIILTEEEAILEVPAIPLYFPTSYSLVKPYVQGFDMNTLDAPLLKDVEIDSSWQPKTDKDES